MHARVHADGVAGAGLHAEAADDAAELVDDEGRGILLNPVVVVLGRHDVDAVGGAGGGAAHAGHAAYLAVVAVHEAVEAAVALGVAPLDLGILDGGDVFAAEEVSEHLPRGHGEAADDLRDVGLDAEGALGALGDADGHRHGGSQNASTMMAVMTRFAMEMGRRIFQPRFMIWS